MKPTPQENHELKDVDVSKEQQLVDFINKFKAYKDQGYEKILEKLVDIAENPVFTSIHDYPRNSRESLSMAIDLFSEYKSVLATFAESGFATLHDDVTNDVFLVLNNQERRMSIYRELDLILSNNHNIFLKLNKIFQEYVGDSSDVHVLSQVCGDFSPQQYLLDKILEGKDNGLLEFTDFMSFELGETFDSTKLPENVKKVGNTLIVTDFFGKTSFVSNVGKYGTKKHYLSDLKYIGGNQYEGVDGIIITIPE